jgi:hypothetical protein
MVMMMVVVMMMMTMMMMVMMMADAQPRMRNPIGPLAHWFLGRRDILLSNKKTSRTHHVYIQTHTRGGLGGLADLHAAHARTCTHMQRTCAPKGLYLHEQSRLRTALEMPRCRIQKVRARGSTEYCDVTPHINIMSSQQWLF